MGVYCRTPVSFKLAVALKLITLCHTENSPSTIDFNATYLEEYGSDLNQSFVNDYWNSSLSNSSEETLNTTLVSFSPTLNTPVQSSTNPPEIQEPVTSQIGSRSGAPTLPKATPTPLNVTCTSNCTRIGSILTCKCFTDSFPPVLSIRKDLNELTSVKIRDSNIPTLNLSLFLNFSKLESLSVIRSKVSHVSGTLPASLISLNLSSNGIKSLDSSVFLSATTSSSDDLTIPHETCHEKSHTVTNLSEPSHQSRIEEIDLSRNSISELPKSIFALKKLKSVFISGNTLHGHFVWDKLWEWTKCHANFSSLMKDADDTICLLNEGASFFNYSYSVLGVLKAKNDLETICKKLKIDNPNCWNCSLFALQRNLETRDLQYKDYPFSHVGPLGSVSLALSVDCSNRNLKQLPDVPPQTWHLNISRNQITSLASLASSQYKFLKGLDADFNQININTLQGTPLLKNIYVSLLSLRHNGIDSLPVSLLESMRSLQVHRGDRNTFLGGNPIDCSVCSSFLDIQKFLREHRKKVDSKEIFCSNLRKDEAIVDIVKPEICRISTQQVSFDESQTWIVVLIVVEIFLIVLIIAKLWYDQRLYRRTGKLPWISQIIPRLPWDTVLEGLKDMKEHQNTIVCRQKTISTSVGSGSIQFASLKQKRHSRNKRTKIVRFKTTRSNSNASQVTFASSFGNSDSLLEVDA